MEQGPIHEALDAIEAWMDLDGHILEGCAGEPCRGHCAEVRAAANGLRALLQLPLIPER